MSTSRTEGGYWLVAGGLNLDILAKPSAPLRFQDSNPGTIREKAGGVGFNIVRNLKLLGQEVRFLTARGEDRAGHSLFAKAEAMGIDMSRALVREDSASSRYLALHDREGDMVVAINDMALFDRMTPDDAAPWLDQGKGDCLAAFLEPNLPGPVLLALARAWQVPLFADAVSVAKMDRLDPVLPYLTGYKLNRHEAEHATGLSLKSIPDALEAARLILERGVKRVCLSLDAEGALFADRDQAFHVRPARILDLVNATGAGDAMASAFAWASLEAYSLMETAKLGLAASSIALEADEAVNPALNPILLRERAASFEAEEVT